MTPDALKHAIEQIQMDEDMRARVMRRSLDHKKEHSMKHSKKIKGILIAAAVAVMALSITAFAAARNQVFITWADDTVSYDTLDEAQAALDAQGSNITLPETFANGYAFAGANLEHQAVGEEDEAAPEDDVIYSSEDSTIMAVTDGMDVITYTFSGQQDSISCTYEKGSSKVFLSVTDLGTYWDGIDPNDAIQAGGYEFYYGESNADASEALATEVDDAGIPTATTVTMSDGDAEDLTPGTSRCLMWEMDGKTCMLSSLDDSMTRDGLIEMALELCK